MVRTSCLMPFLEACFCTGEGVRSLRVQGFRVLCLRQHHHATHAPFAAWPGRQGAHPNFSVSSKALISAGFVTVTGVTAPGKSGRRCRGTISTCRAEKLQLCGRGHTPSRSR